MKEKEGGGVVVSQLEKDWIMAVRKVSANTNSPWPHGSVWVFKSTNNPPPIHTFLLVFLVTPNHDNK